MNFLSENGLTTLISNIKTYIKEKIPTKTSQLTNDSNYIDTVYDNDIKWSGSSIAGDVSPIGMALSNELSANRFAFINPNAIAIEYSTDGGLTWIDDSSTSNELKQMIFTNSNDTCIWLDDENAYVSTSIDSQMRVTLTLYDRPNLYLETKLRKILIEFSTGKHSCEIKLETRTCKNYTNNKDEWTTVGIYKMPPAPDNSWVDIPVDLEIGGTTSLADVCQIRFTFYYTEVSTDQTTNACVNAIFGYGPLCDGPTSNMGKTGHLYDYDMNQNATFPAEVTATNFIGKVNGYTVDKSVPSDAKFTDTTYDLTPYAKTADVDTKLSTKADKNVTKMLTVPNDGWTHNSQGIYTININIPGYGLTVTDAAIIDIDISETIDFTPESVKICQDEWAKIVQAATDDGHITLYATSPPTIPLTIQVRKL